MPRFLLEVHRVVGGALGLLVFALLAFFWGVVAIPTTLALRRVWPAAVEHFAALTRAILRAYVAVLPFARIRVEGGEHRLSGPRILVANHVSRLDSPVLVALEPRLAGPVRGYMLRVPVVGAIIRLLGFFDVDGPRSAAVRSMYRAADRAIARGGGLLFYPEGTRSRTGEIGPFHGGAFRLALDKTLPIQPVVIDGLEVVYPPGHVLSPVRGRHPVRIRYLAPLYPPYGSGARRELTRRLSEQVREAMLKELAQARAQRGLEAAQARV